MISYVCCNIKLLSTQGNNYPMNLCKTRPERKDTLVSQSYLPIVPNFTNRKCELKNNLFPHAIKRLSKSIP